MDAKELLDNLIRNFNPHDFIHFFRQKNRSFRSFNEPNPQYTDEDFTDCLYIGEIPFNTSDRLIIYAFKVGRDLTERSGKKAQYEKGKRILRDELADAGIFIFYDSNGRFRFSLIHTNYIGTRREWSHFKRFTYFVSPEETNRTFLQRIGDGDFSSLETIKEAFSVEKVTEEFFEAYRYALKNIVINSIQSPEDTPYAKKYAFGQQLLSRILFIYFLQKKGWLKWRDYKQDKGYIGNLWQRYKEYIRQNNHKENTFYSQWLSSLFFGAFNKKSHLIDKDLPADIQESFRIMPYLNGGLFTENELDAIGFTLPDSVFEWLFEPDEMEKKKGFLEIFNFTIDESMPLDVEIAVDPEMLGKVYESLIAEEERGSAGIFYTPRLEIELMCKLSLVEYLSNKTQIPKSEVIDFVFNASENARKLDLDKAKTIKSALDRAKIVDPAVGSASFIVGMMNILVELHFELTKRIDGREENLFALKQKILLENLYGVDVKDWAVMVGELRLWLSLIIETDEKYMDIYTRPLLPNLSFKIRQGDSLVEEIGGIQLALRGDALRFIPADIKNRIRELIDKKSAFFSGQRSAELKELKEIEKMEQDIFTEILEAKIYEIKKVIEYLKDEISKLKDRKDIFGDLDKRSQELALQKQKQIEDLEIEEKKYTEAIVNLKNKTQKDYFLWEIDFAEVFVENGGFDIVIGNPPYVRQELIAPPLENKANYTEDEWRNLKNQYKDKLITSVKNIWKDIKKIDKKSDLYVYFYYHGLSLLNSGGIFCFINSNSWLDVGYGAGLQEFLLKNMRPIYIIDNLKKRSFSQADVNTVIVLIQRAHVEAPLVGASNNVGETLAVARNERAGASPATTIKFIAFKKPFEDIVSADVIKRIESYNQPVFDDEDFRLYPKTKKDLLLEGVEIPDDVGAVNGLPIQYDYEHLPYIGNKWGGKYLRAPEIYFKILEKGKGKLVRLGDIAEVKAGIITGNNKKYYTLKTENFDTAVYYPVFKSPRDVNKIILIVKDTKWLIKIKDVPYEIRRAPILWVDLRGDKHICHYNVDDIPFEHNFYGIFGKKIDNETLCLILNSTLTWFLIEVLGRRGLGGGAIRLVKIDILKLPILINLKLSMKNFSEFITRPIHSIFTELGFDPKKPIREQEPNPLPDRKALDDIVFDALGLTEEERKEVYFAVAELVKNRLEKARSV